MNMLLITHSIVVSAVLFVACKNTTFTDSSATTRKPGTQLGSSKDMSDATPTTSPAPDGKLDPTPSGAATPTPVPTATVTPSPTPVIYDPIKCTAGSVTFVSGTQSCPANSTVYAADDGSDANFACCSLPRPDFFDTTTANVVRGGECADNELVVGTSGNNIVCHKLDTTKYKLGIGSAACYFGSGAAGSSGAGTCNPPNALMGAIGNRFGSDGCIAPEGAVVHGRKGRNCGDIPVRQLLNVDGTKVAFPY